MPDGEDRFWLLSPDRSCRIDSIDRASGQTICTMIGRWYAKDGKFVCDWEENWLTRAKRVLPARWRGFHDTKIDPYLIESVDEDELVLIPRGGANYPLQRVAGR